MSSDRFCYTLFYINNIFISNARLKLVKNQANAKQHLELELLLFVSKRNKQINNRKSVSVFMRLYD